LKALKNITQIGNKGGLDNKQTTDIDNYPIFCWVTQNIHQPRYQYHNQQGNNQFNSNCITDQFLCPLPLPRSPRSVNAENIVAKANPNDKIPNFPAPRCRAAST